MAVLLQNIFQGYLEDPSSLEEDMFNAVTINRADIREDCKRQPSTYLHWATLAAIADSEFRKMKRHVEKQVWPEVAAAARAELLESGQRPTEAAINELASPNPMYQDAMENLSRYGHVLDIMRKVQEALWQRRDMLKLLNYRSDNDAAHRPNVAPEETATHELEQWADSTLKPKRASDMSTEDLERHARSILRRST